MAATSTGGQRRSVMKIFLDTIETVGNRLPNPATLFIALAALVLVASAIGSWLGISVNDPRNGEPIFVRNLLTQDGLRMCFENCVDNFAGFKPLGTVLVAMLGIGVAERSGLIAAVLRLIVQIVPTVAITATVVFAGIMSNMASDAGYIVLPPLAAVVFISIGRHPVAGICAAFAGVSAGFSANLVPSTADVLLAGLSEEAAKVLDPNYKVDVLCNYFFMFVSVPLLTIIGTVITERIVEPRLGKWDGGIGDETADRDYSGKGLIAALLTFLAAGIVITLATVLDNGWLHDPSQTDLLKQVKPLLNSMVTVMLILFILPGLAYGIATRRINNDHDVAKMCSETMATMGTYIVLAFAAAQFIKYFEWSELGRIFAFAGADFLKEMNFTGVKLFLAFMFLATTLNLFIGSASAKWALLAPVFVPMFMQLGYSPEATQALYRVGDSVTNIATPLMPYFPIVITFVQKYQPKQGIGSLIALMLPYSVAFGIAWAIMLIVWIYAELPLGPGAPLHYIFAG